MRLFGLIGYPLTHSFSKKYFEEKFKRESLTDCSFKNFPIVSVDELKIIIRENPGLEGLAVTIPHKQSVVSLLDDDKHIHRNLKACNCIKIREGKLIGYNTDTTGFEKSLLPLLKDIHRHALILGNGGAAEAVKFVLRDHNIDYKVVSRRLHDDSSLCYSELGKEVLEKYKVIINTTPLGMYPQIDSYPDMPYDLVNSGHILFDLIYNPAKTIFLKKGEERGAVIQNGYDMLVYQAEENWRIWNG
jgi:shikimate dehydrogenase